MRYQRKNPILKTFVDTKFRVSCRIQDNENQSNGNLLLYFFQKVGLFLVIFDFIVFAV